MTTAVRRDVQGYWCSHWSQVKTLGGHVTRLYSYVPSRHLLYSGHGLLVPCASLDLSVILSVDAALKTRMDRQASGRYVAGAEGYMSIHKPS